MLQFYIALGNLVTFILLLMPDPVVNSQPKGKLPSWVTPTVIAGQGLDAGTTLYGLNHGMRETNPIMPSDPIKNLVTKSAVTGAEIYGLQKLAESHPKLATALGIGIGASGLIPGIINTYRLNHK